MTDKEQEDHLGNLLVQQMKARKRMACLSSKARQMGEAFRLIFSFLEGPLGTTDFSGIREHYAPFKEVNIGALISEVESVRKELDALNHEYRGNRMTEGDLVKDEPTKDPVVEVKPSDYQPSKAELEADVSIDTTPAKLVKAFFSGGPPRREPRS